MKEFIIEADSSIDNAEELIRCKDCRYHRVKTYKYITIDNKNTTVKYCDFFGSYCNTYEVEDDDFCSRAIRKDEVIE